MDSQSGEVSVGDVLYTLSVNILLYCVLIIVFYMLVRFYLEEETSTRTQYSILPQADEGETEQDTKIETDVDSEKLISEIELSSGNDKEIKRLGSFLNVNEWVEPEGTKQEVLQRIVFCGVGLVLSFCIWGLLQERMLTHPYGDEYFVYSYGLVFLTRVGGLVLSGILMYYYDVEWVSTPLYEFAYPSVANMLSSWCQYEALRFVSFPAQMLAKAFKLLPVMLMGKFMHNKKYETYEYVSAATIGFGIYLFLDSSEHIDLGQNVLGDPAEVRGTWCGVVLLVLFLFFDSFTAQWQTRMFELKKNMSPLQMMFVINAFSAVLSFVTLVHQEELYVALNFVYRHPYMLIHLVLFCLCGMIGQLYIFYTVKNFGAVVFSIIMSTRILFSILLSCLVYTHPVTELGVLGITIVFAAIFYRTKRKTEGKPLVRWKESQETKNVFHEWHEHLDI